MNQDDPNYCDDDLFDDGKPVLGKRCATCNRALLFSHFQKDSSVSDGRTHICNFCASSPRLSMEEHTLRMQEESFNSHAAQRMRGEDPDSWMNARARLGKQKSCYDFLRELCQICPDIKITDGRVSETGKWEDVDLVLCRVFPGPQAHLNGAYYQTLGYCPRGILPEFSIHNFGRMGERTDEKRRGWRTILLTCILAGVVSEEVVEKKFGRVEGPAGVQWRKQLCQYRNRN